MTWLPPNAAVQRPRAGVGSATRVHNEMEHARRRRDAVRRSAATACYAALAIRSLDIHLGRVATVRRHTAVHKKSRVRPCPPKFVARIEFVVRSAAVRAATKAQPVSESGPLRGNR